LFTFNKSKNKHLHFFSNPDEYFIGWGNKPSGNRAKKLSNIFKKPFCIIEDGFIRSISLGVEGADSLSIVKDDIGIYYDATKPSKLENMLNNSEEFINDKNLMNLSKKAIDLILTNHISKYNNSKIITEDFFNDNKSRVLIIAQTYGDKSLEFGLANSFSSNDIIKAAVKENPEASIYLKVHPDVLSGKKKSDLNFDDLDSSISIISENINPISLLKHFSKVYTKTSQMGFEAILSGCECVCFGMPFYAGWGLTDDRVKCDRRRKRLTKEEVFAASYILYSSYYNSYTKKTTNILDIIEHIIKYRDLETKTDKKVLLFGFSLWKHNFIKPFLKEYKSENIKFINPLTSSALEEALRKGLDNNSEILIWGKKEFPEIEDFALNYNLTLKRVEDGFIRSVGLGSDLTQAYSLIFDDLGIYFDPTQESRLENIIQNSTFSCSLLLEAKTLQDKIIKTKISKYNSYSEIDLKLPKNKKIILAIGQVENDASIKFGANNMTNLELLQQIRNNNNNSFIIYKPHPDVLSGNRPGNIPKDEVLKYADINLKEGNLHSLINTSDEIHTMTSLTGFEALLLGKNVTTYGMPFYAGWGLTNDINPMNLGERRSRKINLLELIASTLILYPRYLSPTNLNFCEAGVLIDELLIEKNKIQKSFFYRMKINTYNLLSRKSQKILSWIK
jgi:capsular polysaccharide export protein